MRSVAGLSFSDDNWARHLSRSIAEYLRNCFINSFFFFFLPLMFGSILGLWDVQPLVPILPGSARGGLPLRHGSQTGPDIS